MSRSQAPAAQLQLDVDFTVVVVGRAACGGIRVHTDGLSSALIILYIGFNTS